MDRDIVLGLDVGTRRIGVAYGDTEVKIAAPLDAIENDGNALDKLAKLVARMNVSTVVVACLVIVTGAKPSKVNTRANLPTI